MKILSTIFAIAFSLSATSAIAASQDVELRVFMNDQCIVTDEPYYLETDAGADTARIFGSILVRYLAGTLLDHVVSGVAGSIRAGAKRKDTTFALAEGVYLYQADLQDAPAVSVNPTFGCITLVGGTFSRPPTECASQYIPRTISPETAKRPQSQWQTNRTDESVENVLRRANVCLDEPARSVLEARVEFSDDNTAFRLAREGIWIKGPLSTNRRNATRHVLYTLEVYAPGSGQESGALSTLWMNVGEVSARNGLVSLRPTSSEWIRVPELSATARRAYQADTGVHQELHGEIMALERSLARDRRVMDGMQRRLVDASAAAKTALQPEVDRLEIRALRAESMLEALRAEYAELDHPTNFYMPVNIEIGVTEAKSENKASMALASIIESNRGAIVAVAADAAGISRSFGDQGAAAAAPSELDSARAHYFDALIAVKTDTTNDATAESSLQSAKARYNQARVAIGLEPVE